MIDLATPVLGSFQSSLDLAFGNDLGWVFGHLILVSAIAASVLAIRERNHIMAHSGIDKRLALDVATVLLLSLAIFWVFTTTFDFSPGASVGLSLVTALFLRWLITVMG